MAGEAAQRRATPSPVAVVLASASPQRRAILQRLGITFTVRPSEVVELHSGEPGKLALENALRKLRAARRGDGAELVLACDTVVALGGEVYGKPADDQAARETLRALSGVTHEVFSGLAVGVPAGGSGPPERTAVARTEVSFRAIDERLLDWYVALGEWRGRAGGYAIQGAGAALVRELHGDYENVVGLPLATLLDICPELLSC